MLEEQMKLSPVDITFYTKFKGQWQKQTKHALTIDDAAYLAVRDIFKDELTDDNHHHEIDTQFLKMGDNELEFKSIIIYKYGTEIVLEGAEHWAAIEYSFTKPKTLLDE